MESLINFLKKNKNFVLLFSLYFFFTLINLTALPIYNDESIYLDWGWLETHLSGHLFESLYDAKQPLLMWIFGIFGKFIQDPLIAGRLVSVIIGSATMIGIYLIAKRLFDKKTATLASAVFSITPIFIFYNKMALMEAAIACIGIWSFKFLLDLIDHPRQKSSILLGLTLGLGFFIKSSSLLFISSTLMILLFLIFFKKNFFLFKHLGIILLTILAVDLLLLIEPLFWETFASNSRYSLSPSEVLTLPVNLWLKNFLGFFEIGTLFMTPFVFLGSLIGIALWIKKRNKKMLAFLTYFIFALALEILSVKNQSQRYIVAFLPFLVVPVSYSLTLLWERNRLFKLIPVAVLLFCFYFSIRLLLNPVFYIIDFSRISPVYSDTVYIYGPTAGFGVKDAADYLTEKAKKKFIIVGFALNAGNPESGVDVYLSYNKNVGNLHIDGKIIPNVNNYECLSSKYPVYFVSRDEQLVGLEKFFQKETAFRNPYGNYSIGIYKLKSNCTGKTLSLLDFYQPSLEVLKEIK